MFCIKICQWLDLNRRPLLSEATALPTEPQPLPNGLLLSLQRRTKFHIGSDRQTTTKKCRDAAVRNGHLSGEFPGGIFTRFGVAGGVDATATQRSKSKKFDGGKWRRERRSERRQ